MVYHTICENQSIRSMACLSKVLNTVFGEKNFECSRTKAAAIATNVFHPLINESIRSELDKITFISAATDASNHGNIKLFPVIFRYFLPLEGIRTRMVDLVSMTGEKAQDICNLIVKVLNDYGVTKKMICFCGDNCPTNFGKPITRTGKNNVFYLLKNTVGANLIGIGCLAHLLHNAIDTGCSVVLPHDMEAVVVKIYKHFYIYTQRTEALKVFCESKDIAFENLKSYGTTRFVAMKECLTTIIKLFDSLVEYFKEHSNETPVILKNFFDDPLARFLLQFLRDACQNFESTILKVEGDRVSGVQALLEVLTLKNLIESQLDTNFLSIAAMEALNEAIEKETDQNNPENLVGIEADDEHSITKISIISKIVRPFYGMFLLFLKCEYNLFKNTFCRKMH